MNRFFRRLLPLTFAAALLAPSLRAEPQWIWSWRQAKPKEKEIFRKTFTIAGAVKSATLTLTCDNGASAQINGQPAAENPDWNQPVKVDAAKFLKAGENELRIEGRNNEGVAALLAAL